MNKRLMAVALMLCAIPAAAQMTAQQYKENYERQIRNVGYAGVGVETILNRWEEAAPDDGALLVGKFHYFLEKGTTSKVLVKDQTRYLGNDPVISVPDSSGKKVNYFEEYFYDEELFGQAQQAIERAIQLYPNELAYRLDKITSLTDYEKESPDMAAAALSELVDYNRKSHPSWTYEGSPVDQDVFLSLIQQYCYSFYRIGTPNSLDSFLALSEKMAKLYPKNPEFQNNIGTYWLVVKKNNRKALSYYNKVIKLDPDHYAAIKNCVLLARSEKDTKLEKKYLPMLVRVTESESERMSAQARLDYLSGKR